jgi:thiosulfate dehydrogenase
MHRVAPAATTPPPAADGLARMPAIEQQLAALPQDPDSELVRRGYLIFVDTPGYAPRYSGNSLSCANCHLDAGQRAGAAPMWAAWGMYPAWLPRRGRISTFEQRIQQCFRFSMNGRPPPLDSPEVQALAGYSRWLAHGRPVGVPLPGRGYPAVAPTGLAPDAGRGQALYGRRCALCHGADGAGQPQASGRTLFPALWGAGSYNQGAGMHRPELLAAFLKGNMPYGNPDLADQEALDLAAWIDRQPRPADPQADWWRGVFGG